MSVQSPRIVELLSPARNADVGIEAIRHGADAVYIGAGKFGARAAAGNSVEDIARLVGYAHLFGAKVYVTLNTILTDSELKEAESLVWELYNVGVDALIVQDLGILSINLPPIPLHASTQMDNRSVEKVRLLRDAGFEQVVLARELSLEDIRSVHEQCPDVALEVFVHGALCVSLSGQCYVSEACFRRSANRGECAQVCRMEFDLEDANGRKLVRKKHLLSLKDLCHIDVLEDLLSAGVVSLKIEGRLKDEAYVKNVTAAYSEALNSVIASNPGKYRRSSIGEVRLGFTPDVAKSFNRGFTHYFLYGRRADIFSYDTPKALGEEVGTVKEVYSNHFTVAGVKSFSNGDGLCFVDRNGRLHGFRVNRVEDGKLYPLEMPYNLSRKMRLFRNVDQKFLQQLSHVSAERVLPVDVEIDETDNGFRIAMTSDDLRCAVIDVECDKQLARSPQSDNLKFQFSKLGGTGLELRKFTMSYKANWFVPSSLVGKWRRQLVEEFMTKTKESVASGVKESFVRKPLLLTERMRGRNFTYLANVMNRKAEDFYRECGAESVEPAFEKRHQAGVPLMFCRHCIRYSMGMCPRNGGVHDGTDLFLRLVNGLRFRLEFDCRNCMMKVVLSEESKG